MGKIIILTLILIHAKIITTILKERELLAMAINLLFNDGWQFTKQEIDTPIDKFTSDEITWKEIDIPHDWLIYDVNNLYETSEGWYKKDFMIEDLDKKSISIRFEGVYMNTFVYVNGELAGEWKYGYSTFEFDITNFFKWGRTLLML